MGTPMECAKHLRACCEIMEWFWSALCVTACLLNGIQAVTYEMVAEAASFFEICDVDDNNGFAPITELLDVSNIRVTATENPEIYLINGYLQFQHVPNTNKPIRMFGQVFEWQRGRWAPTLFSLIRNDYCTSIFNAKEISYFITKNIPEEYRVCPPTNGTKYHLVNATNTLVLNLPQSRLESRYKLVVKYEWDSFRTCISAILDMSRVYR